VSTGSYDDALTVCERHAERLRWALTELAASFPLSADRLRQLDPGALAVIDQMVLRYSKLQDAMGTRLLPAVLDLTQEPGEFAAFIDKLNRLEKIGAIESAARWQALREMRNQFAHDYPNDPEIQASLLNKGYTLAGELLQGLEHLRGFAARYLSGG
jgi:hypothetical protein